MRKEYLKKYRKYKISNLLGIKRISETNRKPKIIVSLTSVPKRFDTLYLTIESIFNQTLQPDKIVLYLGNNTKSIMLPKKIKKLVKRGLTIEYRDDSKLGPHTKYFYALQEYKNDIVVTFDDDILYDKYLIEELYSSYLKFPKCISSVRPHKIVFTENKEIDNYNKWIFDYNEADSLTPSYLLCQTGVGGVLYPPNIYPKKVFNKELINSKFKRNDDLYLYFNQVLNGIKVVRSGEKQYFLDTIEGTQDDGLVVTNLFGGGNDEIIKKLVKHYNIKYSDFTM